MEFCNEKFLDDVKSIDIYLYSSATLPVPPNVPVDGSELSLSGSDDYSLGTKVLHIGFDSDEDNSSADGIVEANPTVKVTSSVALDTSYIYAHEASGIVIYNIDELRDYVNTYMRQYLMAAYHTVGGKTYLSLPLPNTSSLVAEEQSGSEHQLKVTFKCQSCSPLISIL